MKSLILFKLIMLAVAARTNVISTAQGRLQGVVHDGYISYEGIPYATIVGSMGKFKHAGLAPIWHGVKESQRSSCSLTSDPEECLQLDVHVPSSGSKSWPVLAWVTGGSGYFNPEKLVKQEIIVVIIHHRHGPYGFLCLMEDKIPGNAGVKDVVLALKWIRDNIVAFEGNSTNIVIAGQGFGAAMVEAVMLLPLGDGLYHGAILQSGTILAPWAFNYDAKARATALANLIDNEGDRVSVLLRAQIGDLVSKSDNIEYPYLPFGICKEIYIKKEEIIMSKAPIDVIRKSQAVPLLIGFNSDEAYIFASILNDSENTKKAANDVMFLLPDELKIFNERELIQVSRQIQHMYFEKNFSMEVLLSYHGETYFSNHIYRSAAIHASAHQPVYLYRFSHVGKIEILPEPGVKKFGASHSDELGYLFSTTDLIDDDSIVQDELLQLWANFVKYLNPNQEGFTQWHPLDLLNPKLLDITTETKMIGIPHIEAFHMWDKIYDKYYYSKYRNAS